MLLRDSEKKHPMDQPGFHIDCGAVFSYGTNQLKSETNPGVICWGLFVKLLANRDTVCEILAMLIHQYFMPLNQSV